MFRVIQLVSIGEPGVNDSTIWLIPGLLGGGRYNAARRHHGLGFDPLEVSVLVNLEQKKGQMSVLGRSTGTIMAQNGTFWTFYEVMRPHIIGFRPL